MFSIKYSSLVLWFDVKINEIGHFNALAFDFVEMWVVGVRFFVKFKIKTVAMHLWKISLLRNFPLTKKIFRIVVSNVFISWQYFVDFSKQTLSTWKALYHHQKNKGVKTPRFISTFFLKNRVHLVSCLYYIYDLLQYTHDVEEYQHEKPLLR